MQGETVVGKVYYFVTSTHVSDRLRDSVGSNSIECEGDPRCGEQFAKVAVACGRQCAHRWARNRGHVSTLVGHPRNARVRTRTEAAYSGQTHACILCIWVSQEVAHPQRRLGLGLCGAGAYARLSDRAGGMRGVQRVVQRGGAGASGRCADSAQLWEGVCTTLGGAAVASLQQELNIHCCCCSGWL